MSTPKKNRRRFLVTGLTASAGVLTTGFITKDGKEGCDATPEQDLGPFYPHVKTGDGDLDLTTIQGKSGQASGEIILVRGRIFDNDCQPVEGALVEIWQANSHGRYSHEGDSANKNPLDPFFEGWGETLTNEKGEYGFKTIKPAAYTIGSNGDNPEDWRTPHIHFRVSKRGYHEIVTQMYFTSEILNDTDIVLAELPEEDRAQFILTSLSDKSGFPLFSFDLTLAAVRTKQQRKADLIAYCGNYSLEQRGPLSSFSIHEKEGQLYLDMPHYTSVELKPGAKDEFIARPIYLRLLFNRDDDGQILGVVAYDTAKSNPRDPRVGKKVS